MLRNLRAERVGGWRSSSSSRRSYASRAARRRSVPTQTRRSTRARTRSTPRCRRASPRSHDGGQSGEDGDQVEADVVPAADDGVTGVFSLARADLFNLVVHPADPPGERHERRARARRSGKGRAAQFCLQHRAFFIVDPHPDWTAPSQITGGSTQLSTYITIGSDDRKNAALYFPYFSGGRPAAGRRPSPTSRRAGRSPACSPAPMRRAACGRRRPASTRASPASRS